MPVNEYVWNYPEYKSIYPGSFPKGYMVRLLDLLQVDENQVLQVFGGRAETGVVQDINPSVKPDLLADAHNLPYCDDSFELVICDPPYSNNDNYVYYGNKSDVYHKRWIKEAVRVSSKYVVTRHVKLLPKPAGCVAWGRVFLTLNPNRYIHLVQIFKLT